MADALGGIEPGTRAAIDSLKTGEAQSFLNSNGDATEFAVQRLQEGCLETSKGYENYRVNLGEDSFDIRVAEGLQQELAIGRIVDYYSQQPENLREAVETVAVEAGRNPADPYWAKAYNMPGFESAATGGSGTITFWNGLANLNEGTFNHEFGHNVGTAVRSLQNEEVREAGTIWESLQQDLKTGDSDSIHVPRGASVAARTDGNAVSDYGQKSIAEDFAEFYSEYRDASEEGPEALSRLQNLHPARYSLFVNEVLSRTLEAA